MKNSKFQCATTTCLPFSNVIKLNIFECQITCLNQIQCNAITFHSSTSNCELFVDILNENENMVIDTNAVTRIVMTGTRLPPEPSATFASTSALSSTFTSIFSSTSEVTASTITGGLLPISLMFIGSIYGIFNTTIGSSSSASTSGIGPGRYPVSDIPSNAFDHNVTTKYGNPGPCFSSQILITCGLNTGVYFELLQSLVIKRLQICTGDDFPERDPFIVSLEGSNQTGTSLILGSSWSLIYNGTSGLQTDPGRRLCGVLQSFNNSISYKSYRFLVSDKRAAYNNVQYSELYLYDA
ncbi:hypothetical protein I4U23_023420 [Adineta vaga]|nr:hypothetical protein I4U23_023420 [Adineta vaga]